MKIADLMTHEIRLINRTLADHKVNAGTRPDWTLVAGSAFIAYGVRLGRGERLANVEKLLPELAETISARRGVATPVRVRRLPFALEVPHPHPIPLAHKLPELAPHTMLVGRSYGFDGARDELVNLDDQPHVLIAGMTGAGKSVLLSEMLLSLTRNTSPADLGLVLVDLKNEDLVPFCKLPHVLKFAGGLDEARTAVDYVHQVKEDRRRTRQRPFRLVLAIDELAELAALPEAIDQLGSVLSVGRSMAVNVLAATQHPLAKVVGAVAKANFPVRLVGLVTDANAASVATGRPGTGAEYLPGNGAFVRVQSADVIRFQAHYVTPPDVRQDVRTVRAFYGPVRPADVPYAPAAHAQRATTDAPNVPADLASVFKRYADETGLKRGGLAAAIRALYGRDAPTGGRAYQDAVTHVLDVLERWKRTAQKTSGSTSGKTSGGILPREKPPKIDDMEASTPNVWF